MEKMNELWGSTASCLSAESPKAAYFRQSKFAMFVHWGLYSQAGGQWNGKTYHGITEWLMCTANISAKDYAGLAKEFNPSDFDAADFVATAKAAGMKYIIITAKHHEGFAMFKSADPFNIYDATPFKRDPMAELAEECRKQGLGLGFYYSQFQDWQAYNRWDESLKDADFNDYFQNKCLPQIKELLTNYGKLALIWFDTPGAMTEEQSRKIVELVREYQPDALVNSRIGNGVGDYSSMNDNEVPAERIPGLWECIRTSNNSWGYSDIDQDFCSGKEILHDLISVTARGGTFMVNVGPDRKGRIPAPCRHALLETGKWMQKYGETVIYGANSSPWNAARQWGDCTRRGNKAYFILNNWTPGGTITDYGFPGKISEIVWLGGNKTVEFNQEDDLLKLTLPFERGEELYEVLEVHCSEPIPELHENILVVTPENPCRLPAEQAVLTGAELKHDFWAERFGEFIYVNIIHNWQPGGKAKWDFELSEPGYYRISIRYQKVDLANRVWKISDESGTVIERWLPDAQQLPPPPLQTEPTARMHTAKAGVIFFRNAGHHTLSLESTRPELGSELQVAELILEHF